MRKDFYWSYFDGAVTHVEAELAGVAAKLDGGREGGGGEGEGGRGNDGSLQQ